MTDISLNLEKGKDKASIPLCARVPIYLIYQTYIQYFG